MHLFNVEQALLISALKLVHEAANLQPKPVPSSKPDELEEIEEEISRLTEEAHELRRYGGGYDTYCAKSCEEEIERLTNRREELLAERE